MAVRVPEIDYYSLHGIWGAYGSLVLGRFGRGAGVVVGDVQAAARAASSSATGSAAASRGSCPSRRAEQSA